MNTKRSLVSACPDSPGEAPFSRLEQIRGKALELFAERGFAEVGMRELALHLGIGTGSFYHHFENKEQLLFELIEELYEDLLDAVLLTDHGHGHGRLQALLRAHIALHEHRGLHFLIAEREYRCLSPQHQGQIQQMRRRYEDKLLARLLEAGATGPLPVLKATVQGVVAWLNNLSAWLDQSGLLPAQRWEVIGGIVLGSLSGALKQPTAAEDSATVVPLRVPGTGLRG
ncbi:TetR/AcrR family transcriptional regulator [uncultured Pseudomonas sp.]|uniref:TetR/AcrR family transcriptional regulator n=1 Tax=uncultured Pseudomonas sp. TaxID=114707 RepID=UPI002618809D|nr:TetR/AcrR family transcriptional regulator [uncultured Pseudomonas sp.]